GGGGQVAGVAAAAVAGAVAAARAGGADAGEPIAVGGNGPLSKVLSTITSTSNAPSKGMAAAVPATDRLGDVPLIGVPPDAVRGGSTWQGVGRQDNTSPGTDTLLAGLGAVAGKPPSKRERESNPDAHSPAPGQVARGDARRASGADDAAPTTPRTPANAQPGVQSGGGVRAATAATLDEVLPSSGVNAGPPASRDTFSSQSSDARRALPRSRTGLVALAGALILLGVTAAIVVVTRGSSTSAGGESTGGPAASGAAAASSTAADGTANGGGATNVTGTASAGAATESGPTANGDAGATGAETTEATPASATGTPNGAGAGASATAGGNIVTTARGVTAPPSAGKSGHAPTGHAKATATGATTAPPTTTPGTNATTPPKPTASGDFIRHF
ncbi:MAG: hypothetical protein KF850_38745, partial [Labilithrix sp.]|nr:hypothetical protein [Labilithrix sp.]